MPPDRPVFLLRERKPRLLGSLADPKEDEATTETLRQDAGWRWNQAKAHPDTNGHFSHLGW